MLVALVEPRGSHFPTGHMVIGHEVPEQPDAFFGYRVELDALPEDIASATGMDFLFKNFQAQ